MLLSDLSQSSSLGSIVDHFDDLSGYEKGALARALIKSLIKQGSLEALPSSEAPGQINILVEEWQLKLLARLNEEVDEGEAEDEKEILLDRLCQLS